MNNPKGMADSFNKHFITAASKTWTDNLKRKEAVKLSHESKNDDMLQMKLIPMTETEIKYVIESLK
jgi:hypothetical protein